MRITKFANIEIRDIPTKVRLFKAGENKSSKGTVFYNPEHKDLISQNQLNADGRDLYPIDIAHLSLTDASNPDAHVSVGWFKLSLEDDGIYATDIEWTDKGRQYLSNREFRFISPAFYVDDEKNIIMIDNFALTNEPATLNPLPLVASKETQKEQEMSEEQVNLENSEAIELEKSQEEEPKEEEIEIEMPEEEGSLNEDLLSQIQALQSQLMEANQTIADLQTRMDEMAAEKLEREKSEILGSIKLSKEENAFFSKLSLEQVKEYSQIRLSKHDQESKVVVPEVKEEEAAVIEEPEFVSKKFDKNSYSKSNLPTLEQIKAKAQLVASQRKLIK